MSDGTINAALRRLDFGNDDHVAHGFRAMARTMIAERIPGIPADMVEAQQATAKAAPWVVPMTVPSTWGSVGR